MIRSQRHRERIPIVIHLNRISHIFWGPADVYTRSAVECFVNGIRHGKKSWVEQKQINKYILAYLTLQAQRRTGNNSFTGTAFQAGLTLASAGPDMKHFAGPTQWCVEIFEGVHQGVMIEIGDDTKARPERVTPRPLRQRLQWTTPLNPAYQRITTLINTSSLVRYLPDQKRGV